MRVSITDPGMTPVHSNTDYLRSGRYMSTSDRPTAGSIVGGKSDEDRGFFPFSLLAGAMAMEGTRLKSDWKWIRRLEEERGTGSTRAAKRK